MTVRMVSDHSVGGFTPRFACDSCGTLIDDGVEALVLWVVPSSESDLVPDNIQPVFHAHRGSCDDRLRAKLESAGGYTYWEGLVEHTIHLANGVVGHGRGAEAVPLVSLTRDHPLKGRWGESPS